MPDQRGNGLANLTEEGEDDTREWLTTYADMVTLLLTFFVMLLAISSLDAERFEKIMTSIQFTLGASVAPGGLTGRIDVHDVQQRNLSQVTGTENEPLLKDLRQMVDKKNLDDRVQVIEQGDKVIVRVKGQALFASGSAELNPGALPLLDQLAKIVKSFPDYKLDLAGHTDSRPVSGGKMPSNWELSALRATAVLRQLIERGVSPRRMTATGYAHTDPLAPNTSDDNMAKNRRVEFVLEKKTQGEGRGPVPSLF